LARFPASKRGKMGIRKIFSNFKQLIFTAYDNRTIREN